MIRFPNAKINLGLKVLRKRPDGYHDIETVFYPFPFCDILEIVENEHYEDKFGREDELHSAKPQQLTLDSGKRLSFSTSGIPIGDKIENNLCVKAVKMFDRQHPLPHDISMHLHKIIPMGAGLGGGSSDAAEVLKMLNIITGSKLSDENLISMAAQLGSDCAFFIRNVPAFAEGRGEILSDLKVSLSGKYLLLVNPRIHVATSIAFAGIVPAASKSTLKQSLKSDIAEWKGNIENDFEISIFKKYPEINSLKNEMYRLGAVYAAMSGSGSSVFGIFERNPPDSSYFSSMEYFSTHLK